MRRRSHYRCTSSGQTDHRDVIRGPSEAFLTCSCSCSLPNAIPSWPASHLQARSSNARTCVGDTIFGAPRAIPLGLHSWKRFRRACAIAASCASRLALRAPRPHWVDHHSDASAMTAAGADKPLRLHDLQHRHGSPLASSNRHEHREKLQALFVEVRQLHSEVRQVLGFALALSLLSSQAYKWLFPPAYVESLRPAEGPYPLNGSSNWGQVLNHRDELKPGSLIVYLTA
ncbi:hypothetical protein SAMN05444746_1411 [Variovorax sp. OK212]|nr:hypothetical protein SAMN05518853_1431 [Variovorax sp. OK202]SFE79392.1 hypothetical protein SAMN05444746_1411 [Variovorax sp. OK212]